jgi:hypothetical protein
MIDIKGNNPVLSTPAGDPITGGNSGDRFIVSFPQLPLDNAERFASVRVRVYIPGTSLSREIEVTQTAVRMRPINIVSADNGRLGSFSPSASAANQNASRRLRNELINATGNNNFGLPPATVFSGQINNMPGANFSTTGADIFVYNGRLNQTQANAVVAWLRASQDRVLVVMGAPTVATDRDARRRLFTALGGGYTHANGGPATDATIRTIRAGTNAGTHPLANYLFRTGPFTDGTTDISSQINLRTNVRGSHLSRWPGTFIPLIMRGNTGDAASECVVGIDPTNRVIFIGGGYFGGLATGTTGFNTSWQNPANIQFVRNIAAWMVEVTQQGEEFTNSFIPYFYRW